MKTLSSPFAIILFSIIINVFTPPISAQPMITDIGNLFQSFGSGSRALSISPDGSTIVGVSYNNAGASQGFIWTESTQMVGLNWLNFGFESRANHISSNSKITGFIETNRGKEAVIWINNEPDSIRGFPPLTVDDEGTCISDDGSVIAGYFKNENMSGAREAFRWTSSSGLVGLGDLPGGAYYSYARGVSSDGNFIVGESSGSTGGATPIIWNQTDGMKPLTYFDGTIPKGIAYDVSADGKIVVGEVNINDDIKPFLWTQGSGIVELGTNNSSSYLSARTISSDGKIVAGTNGFIWDIVNGTRDFSEILYDFGIDNQDLYLFNITGISDNNQIFTGYNSLGKSFRIEIPPYVKVYGLSVKEKRISSTFGSNGWTRPDDLILVDETWNIHFSSLNVDSVNIYHTVDNGATFTPIILNYPASNRKYEWKVPEILSTNLKIIIQNSNDPTMVSESRKYKVKGIELTRYMPDSTYEAFHPRNHGWRFGNSRGNMWPQVWWAQFNYNRIDPNTNENYSQKFRLLTQPRTANFPDWPLFVKIAEFNDCYIQNDIDAQFEYRNKAMKKWASIKGNWDGSCFGFAISSFLAFDHKQQFINEFPKLGNFLYLHDINLNDDIREIINELMWHQMGKDRFEYQRKHKKDSPVTTLNKIKIMLLEEDDSRKLRTLSFGVDTASHAVNPYKVEKDPVKPEIEYIYVYDNNYPNSSTVRFLINTNTNKWMYESLGWSGSNFFYLRDPVEKYLDPPILPKKGNGNITEGKSDYLEIYNNYDASITIADSKGKQAGYSNNNYFNNLDDGIPIIPETGSAHAPIGYYLPIDKYSMRMSSFADSSVHCYIFTDTLIFSYNRNDAVSSQTDIIGFNNGFGFRNIDAQSKMINTGTIIVGENYERSFDIFNANLSENDSLNMRALNRKDILLNNIGSEKTYSLRISQLDSTGTNIFETDAVLLPSNSSCIFKPEWENLNGQSLTILIDYGNDGTINDSLIVQNLVTDINSEKQQEIPENYVLHQNYPNPFNPTTTIKFDVKDVSNVLLKIYDMLGREIATLINEQKSPGSYEVNFDASELTSGIYFYTVRANNFVQTKKMLLIK